MENKDLSHSLSSSCIAIAHCLTLHRAPWLVRGTIFSVFRISLAISAYTHHTQTQHVALHFVDTQETFMGGDFTETVQSSYLWRLAHDQQKQAGME